MTTLLRTVLPLAALSLAQPSVDNKTDLVKYSEALNYVLSGVHADIISCVGVEVFTLGDLGDKCEESLTIKPIPYTRRGSSEISHVGGALDFRDALVVYKLEDAESENCFLDAVEKWNSALVTKDYSCSLIAPKRSESPTLVSVHGACGKLAIDKD